DAVVRDLNGVLDAHLKNRFGDIAYHFVIDYTGKIWQGRSLCYKGAHVYGENANNLGIMLQGNFEEQRPSLAQVDALLALIRAARGAWRIPGSAVYGHRDLGRSICPGRFLYEMLDCAKI
ncbi:MAG: peptidoglycan recognition protein family protein, partial [Lentisphaerae bacterium]|nr:peptidoglycan recognition protein family protein [Lentisphaerota bacterium]